MWGGEALVTTWCVWGGEALVTTWWCGVSGHGLCTCLCSIQTIRLARCYKSKLKAVCDGLFQLRSTSSHLDPVSLSALCLELFINAIVLDLLAGRPAMALKHFEQARLSTGGSAVTSNFKGTCY